MKLLDINIICAVVNLLLFVKHTNGEYRLVKFDSCHSFNFALSLDILPANKSYEVHFTADRISTKHLEQKIKKLDAQQTIQVNCELFISFTQNEGIETCQDDDGKYYLIRSKNVFHDETPDYFGWQVSCDDLLADIIEREEVQIQCKVRPKPDSSTYKGKITIGWIQGRHIIKQSHNLQLTTTLNINQTFFGFISGEGIFFYCLQTIIVRCYTLILKVLPQLNVKIICLYETPALQGQRCFQCQATGCADEKVYNWNLHNSKITLKDKNENNLCLEDAPAGVYTIECLVSSNARNSSDVMEFIVTQQDENNDKNNKIYKIMVIILAATTTILVFVVLILVYVLIRKQESCSLQTVMYQQRAVDTGGETPGMFPIDADDVYYTIDDQRAENNKYDYVNENCTQSTRDIDLEISNRNNPEAPQYFVLES